MQMDLLQQPAVVSALVAGAVGLATVSVNAILTTFLNTVRIKADRDLARYKTRLDRSLQKADFAEDILSNFYEADIILNHIRSPGSFESENENRQERGSEAEKIRRQIDSYYPTVNRLNEYSAFLSAFFAKRFRAKALFGNEATQPFDELWHAVVSIQVAAGFLLREARKTNGQIPDATVEKQLAIIWNRYSEPDEVGSKITSAIKSAEKIFGPALKSL